MYIVGYSRDHFELLKGKGRTQESMWCTFVHSYDENLFNFPNIDCNSFVLPFLCVFFFSSPTLHYIVYEGRGVKKFGDRCENTQECGFPGSICDSKKQKCQCIEELPATNHIDKCGKGMYGVCRSVCLFPVAEVWAK